MSCWKIAVTDYEFSNLEIEEKCLSEFNVKFIYGQCRSEDEVIDLAKDADGLLNQYAPIGRRAIQTLKKCKIISSYGVGVDAIDVTAATEKGIMVANVPDYGVEEVSNHALALLFSSARKIVHLNRKVKTGIWDFESSVPMYRYSEQTLGVLGYGRIPRSLVNKAKPFGFRILVYDPYVSEYEMRITGVEPASIEQIFTQSDYITIHVPLTAETQNLVNKENISKMKKNAVIVNTSRGPIIHEDDLIDALTNERIGGAYLDVLTEEPIHPDHPFLQLDNVILTPHIAWYSEQSMIELRVKAVQNIINVMNGGTPKYWVNRNKDHDS
ncbi:C-terminal binding protein [Paenibacillus sp. LMG 31456]|uniref:C-terminal binding protein n=1 Tax=Paenibacillus foliorum TaxID=2654974 RepID=A0A972K5B8_9BACL|nr:C-terminal binding protein [Paenibacillus foliorum]NOU97838.1 C-terminal binding protein [Paenibacillus foliorum]